MPQTLIFTTDAGFVSNALRLSASHWRDPDSRFMRRFGIGLVVSLCLHMLFFTLLPKITPKIETALHGTQGPLVVSLAAPAKAAPQIAVETEPPQPAPRAQTSTPTAPQQPKLMTVPSPAPQSIPLVPETPAPIRPPDAAPTDFMSMVNAKRERRAAAEAAGREERIANGREPSADQIAAANINRNIQTLTQREGTSGVFQILSKGHRAAQFSFRGWTNDARDARRDVIDVDAGLNGNIDVAIVRRMIELIRTHYQGNFNWDSHRLGRVVVLSARIEDTSGLEEFMMREFFK